MNWLSLVMVVLAAVLRVYIILLMIRILLTWVSMDHGHPALRILQNITDPYLNWFRRFRFLVAGSFDFSPVAAIIVVYFAAEFCGQLGSFGRISLGTILAILVQLVWGALAFLLFLLGLASLLRYLGIRFRWGGPMLWSRLDGLLQPVAYALGRRVRPGTFLAYTTTLLILTVSCWVVLIVGDLAFGFLAGLLISIRF